MDKSITLFCITNVNHKTTEFAINKTLENVPHIKEIIIISDRQLNIKANYRFIDMNHDNILKALNVKTARDFNLFYYSNFLVSLFMADIKTSHVLIVQYDGFATNSELWNDKFLDYDYIGPLLNPKWTASAQLFKSGGTDINGNCDIDENHPLWIKYKNYGWANGGGGFSLRSVKLLKTLYENIETIYNNSPFMCEDFVITLFNREYLEKTHDIKFAPVELCMSFCTELYTPNDNESYSLGFHGVSMSPLFLNGYESLEYAKLWYNEEFPTKKQSNIKNHSNHLGNNVIFESFLWYVLAKRMGHENLADWLCANNIFPWALIPNKIFSEFPTLKNVAKVKKETKLQNLISF